MSSKKLVKLPHIELLGAVVVMLGLAIECGPGLSAQRPEHSGAASQRRFYPDDPLWRDGDDRNIPKVAAFDLSKSYEFLNETFGDSVKSRGAALNVNTLGEVPDSSWFVNRIGQRPMTI